MNEELNLFDISRMPAPDEYGFFVHPDVPEDKENPDNEGFDVAAALKAMGYEWHVVEFEFDAPDALIEAYFEKDDLTATRSWQPTKPDGDGWILVVKGDADGGPWALFVRKVQ